MGREKSDIEVINRNEINNNKNNGVVKELNNSDKSGEKVKSNFDQL